jgi:PAS domain S-box-containing protein
MEWIPAALTGIGLATVLTDAQGHVLFMDPVAESLTGWALEEANGLPLSTTFRVENESTRQPAVNPIFEVLANGAAVGLADHTVLIARDGREWRIDHGAAAIRNTSGAILGAVLIFCDVSERQRALQGVEEALVFAEGIVQTVREPLVVLDMDLRVKTANISFYKTFHVTPLETEGRSLFELGNRQWDIPQLRELLEDILPRDTHFNDFKVDHTFEGIGHRSMVLNARRLKPFGGRPGMILLAIENATERLRVVESLSLSETRYRRLFETAQDGILIVDAKSGLVFDANPFLTELLGYPREELVGKELWEIGLFQDIESNKKAFRVLQDRHYIRYEDLPLLTKDGRHIEVEFVSNVYNVGDQMVIQCNIRDVTDRKRAEAGLRAAHDQLELRVRERTAELAQANETLRAEIAHREQVEAERRNLQGQLATAQEDERRRIARELHDQMGQHLTALGLGLKVVKDLTPDQSPAGDRLHKLLALTDQIGREVHHLALELRPTALDDLGLKEALANYVEGCAERSGLEIDFHATGLDADRLPPSIETALYRVIQESLTNILKHAGARRVSVVLQRSAGQVSAVVEDDGGGFDADSSPTANVRRLGLLGMRERLALVDGSLTVESQLARGTTIIARVPLQDGDKEVRDD